MANHRNRDIVCLLVIDLLEHGVEPYTQLKNLLEATMPRAFYDFSQLAEARRATLTRIGTLCFNLLAAFETPSASFSRYGRHVTREAKSAHLVTLQLGFFRQMLRVVGVIRLFSALPAGEVVAKRLRVLLQSAYFELYMKPKEQKKLGDKRREEEEKGSSPTGRRKQTFTVVLGKDYSGGVIFGNLIELLFKNLFTTLQPAEIYACISLCMIYLKQADDSCFDLGMTIGSSKIDSVGIC